jgi:hypothetical protein
MSLLAIHALRIDDLRLTSFTKSFAMRSEHIVHLTYIGAVIIPWNSEAARDADPLKSTEVTSY